VPAAECHPFRVLEGHDGTGRPLIRDPETGFEERFGKMLLLDHPVVGIEGGELDNRIQFRDIAGPRVLAEYVLGLLGYGQRAPELDPEPLERTVD
jgi:hypothetical protein